MADAPSSSAAAGSATPGRDQGPKEEKVSISQPAADVEMEDLSTAEPKPVNPESAATAAKDEQSKADQSKEPSAPQATAEAASSAAEPSSTVSKTQTKDSAHAGNDEDLAIESAVADGSGLAVDIMLLLTSGARHPFRIDEKYLTKRNVTVTGKTESGALDPFSITVYTLKELILRDWRKEWDQAPREPSAIRLIHFGRMLEDRMALNHYQFSSSSRNVIHMTVKPQDIIDEEEAAKKVKESGSERGRSGCCVIL